MPGKYSLPIVHPAFEILKNVCRLLHLVAALFIIINALHQLSAHECNNVICYTQLVIAADILILIFFGGSVFIASPKTGVLFRIIEAFTFTGITITLVTENHPWLGALHLFLSIIYFFIAYREWRIALSEAVELKANGIMIPDFWKHAEIKWLHIKKVVMNYNSIVIETVRDEKIRYELRHNLKIEELQQINDFCSVHSQLSD